MFKQIIDVIQKEYTKAAAKEFGMDKNTIDTTQQCVQNTFVNTIKKQVFGGKVNDVIALFTGTATIENNTLTTLIQQEFTSAFVAELGMSMDKARSVSSFTTPFVIQKIVESFKASGNTSDLDGFSNFTGVNKSMLQLAQSNLGGMFGTMFR
jgi:hypothetical protein